MIDLPVKTGALGSHQPLIDVAPTGNVPLQASGGDTWLAGYTPSLKRLPALLPLCTLALLRLE